MDNKPRTVRFDEVVKDLLSSTPYFPSKEPLERTYVDPIRPEIMAMAERLEQQMRYNEGRGKGDVWVLCDRWYLFKKLEEETEELGNELVEDPVSDEKKVQHEAMDVIAVGFFLWFQSTLREAFQEEQKIQGMIAKMEEK